MACLCVKAGTQPAVQLLSKSANRRNGPALQILCETWCARTVLHLAIGDLARSAIQAGCSDVIALRELTVPDSAMRTASIARLLRPRVALNPLEIDVVSDDDVDRGFAKGDDALVPV